MPVFLHAAASFEPRATSVLLWTRLTGATRATWTIARDAALTDVVVTGEATTGAAVDHTVTVDVDGLEPATTYWYRFEAGGERSPVGRTRTLPAPDAATEAFRLGLVSCARYSIAPLGVYRALAEREVDLVLHLGDYIYEDDGTKGPRTHEPPRECVDLDDYRQRLAQYRRDPDLQALHLRHPMTLIVDDHDVADNTWTTGAKGHDPDEHGDFGERAIAALQARQEWVPSRLRDPDDHRSTWRSFAVGDLAEVVLLETRLAGRHRHAGDEGTPGRDDPERSLLGDEQRAWLRDRLTDTTRPWSLVASGVVISEIRLPIPAAAGLVNPLLPNGYQAIDGEIVHDDQWDGYLEERRRFVAAADERGAAGGRTVVLSADIHSSWAFEAPRRDDGTPVAVEFTFPAVSSKPMGHSRVPGAWRVLDRTIRRLEHVPWVDVTARGYGILDVTRERVTASWWFVEPTAADPAAGAELGAAFTSEHAAWPPCLERLEEDDLAPDPVRPGLPAALPPRPADLPRLRRSHRLRQTVSTVVGAAVPAALVGLSGWRLLRARQA
jgi:alkaline phosphatase D